MSDQIKITPHYQTFSDLVTNKAHTPDNDVRAYHVETNAQQTTQGSCFV